MDFQIKYQGKLLLTIFWSLTEKKNRNYYGLKELNSVSDIC